MLMMPRSCLQFQLETARSAAHGSTTLEPGGDHCATCAAEFQRSVVGNFVSEPWVEVQRDYLFRELPLLQLNASITDIKSVLSKNFDSTH